MNMNILVFGARGDVGTRIVAEAVMRGHQVASTVRSAAQLHGMAPEAKATVADVADTDAITALLADFDLAISAIRPPDGREEDLVALTGSILSAATRTRTRVIIVGGAASLRIPGRSPHSVLTAPGFLPDDVVPIARASFAQYELCTADDRADWTYLSPPAKLAPGERTGRYRTGLDNLLLDKNGNSEISMEDFSAALIDEAEAPLHRKMRFTVAY